MTLLFPNRVSETHLGFLNPYFRNQDFFESFEPLLTSHLQHLDEEDLSFISPPTKDPVLPQILKNKERIIERNSKLIIEELSPQNVIFGESIRTWMMVRDY